MKIYDTADTNATYGATLVRLGERCPNLVVVEADLMKASGSAPFRAKFPERHLEVGIAEQDLLGFSTGLALAGKIPFASSFACFISQRACDQAVNAVAYNRANVKMVGSYAGLTSEKNGGTHISVLDLAIFRSIPYIQVFDPGDAVEFAAILEYAVDCTGPVYIRSNKGKHGVFHAPDYKFQVGKAEVLQDGKDVGLITTGISTLEGICACEELEKAGIHARHVHMPTIKPLDREEIARTAELCGKIVTVENHSINGGLGSAVAEALCELHPAKLLRLGMRDCFGETATLGYLQSKFGIDRESIVAAVKKFID